MTFQIHELVNLEACRWNQLLHNVIVCFLDHRHGLHDIEVYHLCPASVHVRLHRLGIHLMILPAIIRVINFVNNFHVIIDIVLLVFGSEEQMFEMTHRSMSRDGAEETIWRVHIPF